MEPLIATYCKHLKFLKKQDLKKILEIPLQKHCSIHQSNETYYMCLHCGSQCCLGYQKETNCIDHHFKANQFHYFALQISLGGIWCSECRDTIQNIIFSWDSNDKDDNFLKMNRFVAFIEDIWKQTASKFEIIKKNITLKGLINLGNTCFLNVVLQCLNATSPLKTLYQTIQRSQLRLIINKRFIQKDIQYFYDQMIEKKRSQQWNIVTNKKTKTNNEAKYYYTKEIKNAQFNCLLKQFLLQMNKQSQNAFKPSKILNYLAQINKKYDHNEEQDADQLLLTIIDLLSEGERLSFLRDIQRYKQIQKLLGFQKLVPIQSIFGFYLLNQIQCNQCKQITHSINLSYNIAISLDNTAKQQYKIMHKQNKIHIDYWQDIFYPQQLQNYSFLDSYFKVQRLNLSNNFYSCTKCKSLLAYRKSYIISQPQILIISVKRFNAQLKKNSMHVQFPLKIDIKNYCTSSGGAKYNLYAIIVHEGKTISSGHYICFIKSGQHWLLCSDHRVQLVDWKYVQSQQAYILFYEKEQH